MENFILLEKRRKRLSVYFAVFILFSLWIIEFIYLFSLYYSNNLVLEEKLGSKLSGVVNVLENKETYKEKIDSDDITTKLILEKSLEGVSILENDVLILGDINFDLFESDGVTNSQSFKYYKDSIKIGEYDYEIIVREENAYSYYNLLREYFYFILFSIPFSLFFYLIGYIFVGKNFKPIQETISSLESFSSNINHEMKTPLAEIISTLSLSKKLGNYQEAIDQSLKSSEKLNKILDSMLGIINLVGGSYKRSNYDVVTLLREVIRENEPGALEKNISFQLDFKHKSYNKKLNRQHFDICIGNILKNAIKYSLEDGVIEISFENGTIIIKDYGIGIDKKNLKNIFHRYFRENYTEHEGYGLGLALVDKISNMNNWQIDIQSEKNSYTLFQITIT